MTPARHALTRLFRRDAVRLQFVDLMQQQLDFEKTDLFKNVSPTIAGLEEKGLVYSTEMGYVATRAVKVKKVKK